MFPYAAFYVDNDLFSHRFGRQMYCGFLCSLVVSIFVFTNLNAKFYYTFGALEELNEIVYIRGHVLVWEKIKY